MRWMSMRTKLAFLAFAVFGAGVALADQLTGDGSPYWSGALTTSGSTACVKASSGSSLCALFPAGTLAGNWKNVNAPRIYASAAGAVCCWSLVPAADIDTANLEIAADNKGPCFRVPAEPGARTMRPAWTQLTSAGGAATGVCSAATSTWDDGAAGDSLVYPPCVVANGSPGDCDTNHSLDSATCVANASASSTALANVGAYLNCEAASGTPVVYVEKERVLSL